MTNHEAARSKKLFLGMLISVLILPFGLITSKPNTVRYPQIEFTYDWRSSIMDMVGSLYYGAFITDQNHEQLKEQLPKWVATWKKDAPILFGIVFDAFCCGFSQPSRMAIINLSHGNSYGSRRFLILGLRWFLDSEPWRLNLNREDVFSSLVFHELLHIWIDENTDREKSALIKKYCNEDSDVLDHLHLMAMQKKIYLKM